MFEIGKFKWLLCVLYIRFRHILLQYVFGEALNLIWNSTAERMKFLENELILSDLNLL